jgi:flagellar motor switch protein FliG
MAEQELITPQTTQAATIGGAANDVEEIEYDITDLTDAQKAAIVIVSMGQDYSRPIIDRLSDQHMRRFVRALEELREVPRPKMLAVIADFIVQMDGRKGLFRAGPERAMEIARNVLDEDRITRLTSQDPTLKPVKVYKIEGVWAELDKRPVTPTCEFLIKQKPEVSAFVLSKLSNDKVTEILAELPEENTIDYMRLLSDERKVAPFVAKAIENFVRTEFLEDDEKMGGGSESIAYVADLMSSLDRDRRERILENIAKVDKGRALKIRDEMLTFDDLPVRLPTSAISLIFKDYNKPDLIKMLKAAGRDSQPVTEFFFSNISQRMADQIREDVEASEELDDLAAGKAISGFMSFLGGLEKEARIKYLPKPEPEEEEEGLSEE